MGADAILRLNGALEGRYAIESQIGEGGMGIVYRARDLRHDRSVAIKVLPPEVSREIGVARFQREIRIAAGLSHRNILPLFDSGDADGLLYFVMPYVRGESLRARLDREGPLPVSDAVRIAGEVGEALGAAHEAGVVHRDVKPANILLESGHALVADFGVARALDAAGGGELTRTGVVVGTSKYMSPEQASGVAEEDGRSDIYALGCVAYEMLVGAPPFTGSTPQAVVAGHLTRKPPSIRERRPEVPPGLSRAVERALEKEPAGRFDTAEEMVAALNHAMTVEAQAAEGRRATRRRWSGIGAGVAVVALAVLGGSWLADRLSAPTIERLAVLPASNMTRNPEDDPFVDGVHEALVGELQQAGLRIIARQSVLQFRGSDRPIDEIARALGVDALIQPAVGREGDSVYVDVSLFDARTELPVWSASFGTEMRGVIGLYREVSGRIADEIGAVLSSQAEARLAERPIVDPDVLQAVYTGESYLLRFTPQDFDRALEYFELAVSLDSTYAPAHMGVAAVWGNRAQARLVPPDSALPLWRRHLGHTLALDPDLPRARFAEGALTVWHEWKPEEGERMIRRAVALDPDDAQNRMFLAHALMILGRFDEAIAEGERARGDDPLNPFVEGLYGVVLNGAGRTGEAIELLTVLQQTYPGAGFGVGPLMTALQAEERFDEAIELRKQFHARFPGLTEVLEAGFAEGGYPEAMARAAARLADLSRAGVFVSGYELGGLYTQAGRYDEALRWLRVAVEQRDPNLPYLGVGENWRPLHGYEGFLALVEELGLEIYVPDQSGNLS